MTKSTTAKTPTHPIYIEMITAALTELKDRKGTSRQAIVNYIKKNYTVGDTVNQIVKMTLKRNVESKKIIQVSGIGASGSFKLPAEKAPKKKTVAKKPASKPKPAAAKKVKTPAKKAKATKKPPVTKKAPAKKATPKKKSAPKRKSGKK